MLDGEAKLSYVETCLFLREGDLSGEVEAQVASGTVVQSQVKVVRSLEGEVQVDYELVVGLLQDVRLDYCVFQLLLQDQVLLLQRL